jgi:two-component system, chemotaxis family, CheB/CheR fusion protein
VTGAPQDQDQGGEFERLLEFIRSTRGFDFTGYKRAGLARRFRRRMDAVGVTSYEEYLNYLEAQGDEFPILFDTVLINVTKFFRDAPAWEVVADAVLPEILSRKTAGEQIRIWSAGCASGEEAYSVALLLSEILGSEALAHRAKIYATDVDGDALSQARQAAYPESAVADVPPRLLEKYFDRTEAKFTLRRELRRAVIFGRNDLVRDAPISRVDLLICRNTLMYFNSDTQARILSRFHFALDDRGFLMLGKAETLLTQSQWFDPVDLKHRIFANTPRSGARRHVAATALATRGPVVPIAAQRLREAAFDAGISPQVAISRDGLLAAANDRARVLFGITPADVGKPFHALQLSYRPVELRSIVDQVSANHRPHVVTEVSWPADERYFDVHVVPFLDPGQGLTGVGVTFQEVTEFRRLRVEFQRASHEVEAAYEQLQSTNEELETTNEELQSTVEELETTNEELQATNEEFETMNEELHSTNEELQALNDELRRQGNELDQSNTFLESVFASFEGGVIVVDTGMNVAVWNARSEELWGLRASEVSGSPFLALDVGLPVTKLEQPLKEALRGRSHQPEIQLPAVNRRGRRIDCQVRITPLLAPDGNRITGALVITEEVDGHGPSGDGAAATGS